MQKYWYNLSENLAKKVFSLCCRCFQVVEEKVLTLFNTFSVVAKNSVIILLTIKYKSYAQSWEMWRSSKNCWLQ